ncbi:MAG: aspartate carbamoyltransferase catalytic subunit [Elusimicrobia bacterium]|nr:aspartate carbamoyltransferase catalytic subunit [Elusimicrobiota bacterium]MDE2425191.1 aspartate carbamoyltransferase catalytic subunit [Elusimicrobiota bacterium]
MSWDRKDLLGLETLSSGEIEGILDAAAPFADNPRSRGKALSGRLVAFFFSEPSTRTRSSFEAAAKRLGADVLGLSAAGSSAAKGETLLDSLRNLEAVGAEYLVVRQELSGALEPLASKLKASLLNAGDGCHEHPTQALLDVLTLRRKKGRIKGLRVVIVGDILHSRVARSNIHALTALGARVTVCGPSALIPAGIERLGARVSHDLNAALAGADAVNVLRQQLERQNRNLIASLPDYAGRYGLSPERLAGHKDLLILHPGPVNRGVELDSACADGPQSAILEQVANGVAVRMAVFSLLASWRARHAR